MKYRYLEDLVSAGEGYDDALKKEVEEGKKPYTAPPKFNSRKKPEVSHIASVWEDKTTQWKPPLKQASTSKPIQTPLPLKNRTNGPHRRVFTDLGMPPSKALEALLSKKIIQVLSPQPGKEVTGKFPNEWCKYHQAKGHNTDYCFALKHKIQDLIEDGTVPAP